MDDTATTPMVNRRGRREAGLSYKFQRLRERIRQAIESGELAGKLPGERTLARRFHANAKTLSKALTDLAAEGLLDRSIGRGTYVKGTAPQPTAQGPWLLLCDPGAEQSPLVRLILEANPTAQVISNLATLRPSFINPFCAVIDLAQSTPESIRRELVVRNLPFIAVGREPLTFSTHCIMLDRALGAAHLGRELLLSGHRHFAVIDHRGDTEVYEALRKTAARCAPESIVDRGNIEDLPALVQNGVTALICGSAASAKQVRNRLSEMNVAIPQQIALAAVGSIADEAPCTGYFVTVQQEAQAILQILRELSQRRPATFWLVGKYQDKGTCALLDEQTASAAISTDSALAPRGRVA